MTERELPRRAGLSAGAAPARALAPQAADHAPPATDAMRTVIRVGPGSRPAALSPIATGPGRPSAPRAVPPRASRPMHPPIARVPAPAPPGAAALQASAATARPGFGAAARRGAPGAAAGTVAPPRATGGARLGFGMPSLRRNVCPHFFMSGARGAIPIQAPHLLKALVRQETNVSRCQLRGGVHLEQGYVNDVCLSARFNQCVFYEDELSR